VRVLVALSGGVDSSVAAALVRDAGHEVVGVTMRLWGGESDSGCCSVADVEDARRAAAQLGVEHHVFNLADDFDRHVVTPYVEDHLAGRTPNPCIECNRHLKFDALVRRAELLGFDALATGHHARRVRAGDGGFRVGRGADPAKDQSYVLHMLRAPDLARILLPIGELTKAEVRRIAADLGLRTAAKPESQDVCFITRAEGRAAFLARRAALHAGEVQDVQGRRVGTVEAVELVTIGQRRGLDLAGGTERRYVTDVDVPARRVTVGPAEALRVPTVDLEPVVWAAEPVEGRVRAQTSAHGAVADATVRILGGRRARLTWDEPRRRVAPGQSVVLYRHDAGQEVVVGGGPAR
jgi:tRNA-specific 2-thiouridylase